MVLSEKHGYLFIEVPHTASTAISRELRRLYDGKDVLYKHANYSEFLHWSGRPRQRLFVFAAVRNPLDVAVTRFTKIKTQHGQHRNTGWMNERHLAQSRFVQDGDGEFHTWFTQYCQSVSNVWPLLLSKRFDFIMRFEDIAMDFEQVFGKLGIPLVRPLPVVNRSSRPRTFEEFYTPDIRGQAVRAFGPFMSRWGYEFPESWGQIHSDFRNRLAFRILNSVADLGGQIMPLSPEARTVKVVKSLMERISYR